MRRDRREIARAVRGIRRETHVPVEEIAVMLGHPVNTVVRWIVRGCRGVHLAGYRRAGSWYSSAAAAVRFARELAEKDEGATE
jgi:hypothetical protein